MSTTKPEQTTATASPPEEQPLQLTGDELLVVDGVKKHFPVTRGIIFQKQIASVKAVDGLSFTLKEGETLGIVGESGCGKSTLARCIMKLLEPTSGRIVFDGRDITNLSRAEMRPVRREMMMIFQDPYASLNPRKRVGFIIGEPLEVHGIGTAKEVRRRVQELLEIVGLNPEHYNRFPHEFSGGQRQRIGIARALASEPDLLVLDEATSALDVSVQAQVLDILAQLRRDTGLTYLFISHNLGVVRAISEEVLVLRAGKVVERGATEQVLASPTDPYTRRLRRSALEPSRMVGRKPRDVVRGIAAARIAESAASA